jgi:hypothetical protein
MNAIEQIVIYYVFLWRIFVSFGKREIWWRSKVEEEKGFVYQLKRFIFLYGVHKWQDFQNKMMKVKYALLKVVMKGNCRNHAGIFK